ncbi:SRPBCC family protein [Sporosarcina limicola]|uniref:Ligand-binding SRPBCC domain-containing protein n=1 Tax=Sporosarcina limicola TaxID=34101 RepID=A0A927MP09_9BACL|nr:ligand-binding SRPBCC domain-containing protein [Sporosarcina limicola]
MPLVKHSEFIQVPIERCFDLARDVDVHIHIRTTIRTKEKAVGGVMAGLLEAGDVVTWEAIHFGVRQRLTAKITEMNRPYVFKDIMVKGAFHSFSHIHEFIEKDGGTVMTNGRRCFNLKLS